MRQGRKLEHEAIGIETGDEIIGIETVDRDEN